VSRLADHVEAFNEAVITGDWTTFTHRFAADATMTFIDVPGGQFDGRDAIAEAYRTNPPPETMSVVEEADDFARFRWAGGGTGAMSLAWAPNGAVRALVVRFD
jgi:steroid Delta-isomerase